MQIYYYSTRDLAGSKPATQLKAGDAYVHVLNGLRGGVGVILQATRAGNNDYHLIIWNQCDVYGYRITLERFWET